MVREHTYYPQFFIIFVHAFILFVLLIFIDNGVDINYEAFLVGSSVVAILTYAATRYFKIVVTDNYLRGYDFWGKYHTIDWGSVIGVKPIRIVGLKYLRVDNTESRRPLWIPLFLDDISGFRLEVIKRLNSDNPLKKYLDG
jgi:hypothetical protein